jgi:uncharacterized protein YndB with AHSA1/START domain
MTAVKEQTIIPAPIRRNVHVGVSRERAFEIFTARIGHWWPKTHHIGAADLDTLVIEPRQGGRWYERGIDGSECEVGKVLLWDPPARLVLGWQLTPDFAFDPNLLTEVDVQFIAEGANATRVELEHRDLERFGERAEAMRQQIDGPSGWAGLLDLFARYVAQAEGSAPPASAAPSS